VALDPYNLASRLSYFLFGSMPDEPLFARAADGTLAQEAVLSAQVDRMLMDPKALATIASFHAQWLGVEGLAEKERDLTLFPSYTPELVTAMLDEQAWFTQSVVLEGDGLLGTLLTADYGYPSGSLFGLYGMTAPADHQPGQAVTFPAGQRAGLLTQAAFLAEHSKRSETSPVHRGIRVLEHITCDEIEPPPANVETTLPPDTEATTTRERFAQHEANVVCRGCHAEMDAIGLSFENYDAIGAYRTTEGTSPIDATGDLGDLHADLAGPFNNAVELAAKLGQSQTVANCVARQWFRFSLGRTEAGADACSVDFILKNFEASNRNVRELIGQIAKSEAFVNVRSTAENGP
jgi:hypothetical protein